jgi:excinuclease ABC subunit C
VTEDLSARVAALPTSTGVYLLKDANGRILYVGKAANLRARVRSYLADASVERPHLIPFLRRWRDVQVIETRTIAEALMLENSFIKKERPPANVKLRDDKRYLCLRIDLEHEYPRITLVRRFQKDGALYFGPYADAGSLRQTLRALREIFPLRSCTDRVLATIAAPCLYYQLGRCAAPCHGHVTKESYAEYVSDAIEVLRGRRPELLRQLRERMARESESMRFESAARIRDQIHALERTLERQGVVGTDDTDRDVIALSRSGDVSVAEVLFVRDGAVVSARDVALPGAAGGDAEVLHAFLAQFYDEGKYVPTEILVPAIPEGAELLEEVLSSLRGAKVRLRVPERGAGRELMELAKKNAELAAHTHRRDRAAALEALAALAKRLGLPEPPAAIECFDVSHLQGREVVASMVRFSEGRPDRQNYRHFRIRELVTHRVPAARTPERGPASESPARNPVEVPLERNDDFASMNEVLRRRYREGAENMPGRPDLVLIDGGKGQLSAAREALAQVGWPDAPVVSLAKARAGREGAGQFERVFLPGQSDPVVPPPDAPDTLLLARVRDEAHRFAIQYHRKLRSKAAVDSALDTIEGVGDKWRRELLLRFGSVQGIRDASLDELLAVPGLGRKRALRISEHLRTSDR